MKLYYPKQAILFFNLSVLFICFSGYAICGASKPIFGERPEIKLELVDDGAFYHTHVWIKFEDHITRHLDENDVTFDKDGFVSFGISAVDDLNRAFGVRSYKYLYDDTVLDRSYRDRHRKWGFHLWYELQVDDNQDIRTIVKAYEQADVVAHAAPEFRKTLYLPAEGDSNLGFRDQWFPDDSLFNQQWHYHNTGQAGGTYGADISLPAAWQIETGNPQVIVAVIDGGIQADHPDLEANMWEGIGYNFADNTYDILPTNHGTHVAGTVAAVNNNTTGIAGVAGGSGYGDGVRLMSAQIYSDGSSGGNHTAQIYAADHGAAISQNSWGYTDPDVFNQLVLDAIDYFNAHGGGSALQGGGITIFAAGNSNSEEAYYPAFYAGTLSVAATNNSDMKASYSNYGDWIDVSAPGGETATTQAAGVLSTLIGSTFGYLSGTSMACPHVSGVAALIISMAYGELTAEDVTEIILTTADSICESNPDYIGKLGSGRLNAYAALLATQNFEPVESEFASGSGTVDDPYIIATPQHLNNVRNYPNNQAVHFALKNDIDLAEACGPGGDFYYNGQGWEPIGYILNYDEKQEPQGFFFSGTFDGRGYEISGLYINRPLSDNIGLFGYTNVAKVKNLGVVNAQVTGRDFVGALMGVNYCHSVIEKCYSSGVLQGRDNVGGLVGSNMIADLLNSHSSVTVQASGSGAGGIVGMNAGSSVQNSYSTGNVSADSDAGGLAGYNYDSTIQNCFSSSNVLAGEFSGGLIASNFLSNVSNCYSIGQVDAGGGDAGGLIAESFWSTVTNSYWNTQTSGQNASSGGEGRTTLQMTYPYAGNTFSGWDFLGVWAADTDYQENNGYPYLRKELFLPPTHFAGGSGTKTDPFQIANAQHLDNLRHYLGPLFANRYYIQVADIDLNASPWNHGEGWAPIGELTTMWDEVNKTFYGSYDGNGYVIQNLYINRPEDNDQGLFGYIVHASLKNIILQNVNITANNRVGGLVGQSNRSVINNVYVSGYINGNNNIGGLAGEASRGKIGFSGCNVAVSGNDRIGGLAGEIYRTHVQNSYSRGEINGAFSIGGLVGRSGNLSEIHSCYSKAAVNGSNVVGGFIGNIQNGLISHSYSMGVVTGDSDLGGFAGSTWNYEDIFNYWDVDASQISESAMGQGRTTQEMTHPHASNTYESWLFGLTWKEDADHVVNNGYPFLKDFSEPPRKLTAIGGAGEILLSWLPPMLPYQKPIMNDEDLYDTENKRLQVFLERHHMLNRHQPINNNQNEKAILGYNIYRDNVKINTNLVTNTTYADTSIEPEVFYEYFVTAVYSDHESVPSNPDKVIVFIGSGTATDPWQISTSVQLEQVGKYGGADHQDKHFIQTADIDIDVAPWNEDEGWSPIGSKGNKGFFGNYDGQGHNIKGLFISRQDIDYQGLFSKLNGAVIKNLGLEIRRVRGSRHVGGLAGSSYNSWIENCFVVGKNMFLHDVVGTRNVGGLIGMIDSSSQLLSSFSNISVWGGINAGGLVGQLTNSSVIQNSYSTGSVEGNRTAGGLVGRVENAEVIHSYSTTNVLASDVSGGFTAYSYNSEVVNCYWDTETSGMDDGGSGEGRTTSEMTYPYAENTYVDWDFEHIWVADEDHTQNSGYPTLKWQPYVEPDVPADRLFHDISLDPGDSPYCFDASKTITAWDFIVEPGAEVTLIAGQKILFLDGTHISESAYMHAYIAADGPFCMDRQEHFLAVEEAVETADPKEKEPETACPTEDNDEQTHETADKSEIVDATTVSLNIYPNPATDQITIWINLPKTDVLSMEISIYNIHGEHLVNQKVVGRKNSISLEALKPGLYIVQVSNISSAYISRLIIL